MRKALSGKCIATFCGLLAICLADVAPAHAAGLGYSVTGSFSASVCVLGMVCHIEPVNAVRTNDGILRAMPAHFDSVREYNETTHRCFVDTSGGSSFWVISRPPKFYYVTRGGQKEVSQPEWISFPCVRTK